MKINVVSILTALLFFSILHITARVDKNIANSNLPPNVSLTSSVTLTPTPTITPTPSIVPLSTTPAITNEQLLGIQVSVLDTIKWIATIALGAISLIIVAGGAFGLIAYTRISDAAKRADEAKITVDGLNNTIGNLNIQITDAVKQANEAKITVDQIAATSSQVRLEIKENQNEIKLFKAGIKGDIESVRKSILLVQIEERGSELFSEDSDARTRALKALKAISVPEHPPFVRRRAVILLGAYALDSKDKDIIGWLETIAKDDPAASVRRTAGLEVKKIVAVNDLQG